MNEHKIHISVMSGKLKGLRAINTNTLSNPYCSKMSATDAICSQCYSRNMLSNFRKNCVPAFERNSVTLSKLIPIGQLPKFPNDRYIRHDGHGELVNSNHFANVVNLAIVNPQTTFTLWTKRTDIVRRYLRNNEKPDNLILVWSNPKIGTIKPVPRSFDKVFNVVRKNEHTDRQNCTGQRCTDCLECYTHEGASVIVEAIK